MSETTKFTPLDQALLDATGPASASGDHGRARNSATCDHDWVPMLGGEVCYGCNSIRRYSAVTYTALEPFAVPPDAGPDHAVASRTAEFIVNPPKFSGISGASLNNLARAYLALATPTPDAGRGVTEADEIPRVLNNLRVSPVIERGDVGTADDSDEPFIARHIEVYTDDRDLIISWLAALGSAPPQGGQS
jgi:hypothetical protein